MNTLHLKTGDTAVVLSGKEKGKQGKVLSVNPKKGMVVVEGVNMITCHQKPPPPGRDRRHRKARGRPARLQADEGLPEVRQAHPPRCQDS